MLRKHAEPRGFVSAPDSIVYITGGPYAPQSEEKLLRRLFYGFPGGLPGVALLLLRVVFGLAVMVQGVRYMSEPNWTMAGTCVGPIAVVAGGLLLVGFLTPVVGGILGLSAIVVAISRSTGSIPIIFDSKAATAFAITMLLTLIGLGPGAFSIDARLFGRREIIIPPTTPHR